MDIDIDTEDAETAFVGNAFLAVGNGASPETFEVFCAVTEMGGVGEKNDQVDVTTFCNGGSKHYIPGLSDGNEFSFSSNFAASSGTDKTVQDDLIAAVKAKINRNFQIQMGRDSPFVLFSFNAAMLSWEIDPSIDKQNVIKFTAKISGPVDYA